MIRDIYNTKINVDIELTKDRCEDERQIKLWDAVISQSGDIFAESALAMLMEGIKNPVVSEETYALWIYHTVKNNIPENYVGKWTVDISLDKFVKAANACSTIDEYFKKYPLPDMGDLTVKYMYKLCMLLEKPHPAITEKTIAAFIKKFEKGFDIYEIYLTDETIEYFIEIASLFESEEEFLAHLQKTDLSNYPYEELMFDTREEYDQFKEFQKIMDNLLH